MKNARRPVRALSPLLGLLALARPATAQESGATTTAAAALAHAEAHEGDVTRGRRIFLESPKAQCATCHTLDGSGDRLGPDLSAVGVKFPRRELIRAVLEPSASIAIGYAATAVETRDGTTTVGIVRNTADGVVELAVAADRRVRIPASEIVSQRPVETSPMPEGLQAGLTPEEFTDLIAFLSSLQPPRRESVDSIPVAAGSAGFGPFFDEGIRFEHPVAVLAVPGSEGRWLVLEHAGRIRKVERREGRDDVSDWLDLRGQVRVGGATGLLGLAFHPGFAANGRYFLKHHVLVDGRIETRIVERRGTTGGDADVGGESRVLMRIPAATQDHNGGCLVFAPDGTLLIGTGDTGPQRDPRGHGQDPGVWMGKILRIDVDSPTDGREYGIPKDNPFVGREGWRPEIWALGFREPWRFSFDRKTGDLWVGDVGQDRIEEVGIVRRGENHGWNVYEGFDAYSEQHRRAGTAFTPPVFSYSHRIGVSVTGGHVYRGRKASALEGRYVFGDFETRRVWALAQEDRKATGIVEIGRAPSRVVSFGETPDGELLVVGYDDGVVRQLDLSVVDPAPLEVREVVATAERAPREWRWTEATPPEGWEGPGFDDQGWAKGPAGFGSPGTPGAVVRTEWRSRDIWIRRSFVLRPEDLSGPSGSLRLRIHHDEDSEVSLNGIRAARLERWTSGYVDLPLTPEAERALHVGTNVIAVHTRQDRGGQYIDAGLNRWLRPARRDVPTPREAGR